MSDDLTVPCPKCGFAVPLTESLVGSRLDALRAEAEADTQRRLAEQSATAKAEAAQAVAAEQAALKADLAAQQKATNDAKAEQAKMLKAMRELDARAEALDLEVQQRVNQEAKKEAERLRKLAEERATAQAAAAQEALKEQLAAQKAQAEQQQQQSQLQLDSMRRQIETLKQKSEQGSMQAQGEAAELILEDQLTRAFPVDTIEEVGKGARGADCLQRVAGAGAIIWESKRTQNWSNDWAPKLRTDMRSAGADVAVLVSQVRPEGIDSFAFQDGIWICAPRFATALAAVLRQGLAETAKARAARQGQASKTEMLYDYLTGPQFRARVEAMLEPFAAMQTALAQERRAMNKQWALREKQLDLAISAVSGLYGDVQGIAGTGSVPEIDGLSMPLLEEGDE